jgi:hypothetical protein
MYHMCIRLSLHLQRGASQGASEALLKLRATDMRALGDKNLIAVRSLEAAAT